MAIAEPVLSQYINTKVRFRGGSILGTAIGAGIGIGAYVLENYDFTSPFSDILQPDRPSTKPGGAFIGATSKNAQSNQLPLLHYLLQH